MWFYIPLIFNVIRLSYYKYGNMWNHFFYQFFPLWFFGKQTYSWTYFLTLFCDVLSVFCLFWTLLEWITDKTQLVSFLCVFNIFESDNFYRIWSLKRSPSLKTLEVRNQGLKTIVPNIGFEVVLMHEETMEKIMSISKKHPIQRPNEQKNED